MRDYAYYNGVLTPYDACAIPLSDRSIFFADAVYDVLIGRRGIPYQLDMHLERLVLNAQSVGLRKIPSPDEIRLAVNSVLEEAEADEFMLYIQLSGTGRRRAHSRMNTDTSLLITVTSVSIPTELSFIDAVTLPDLRYGYCNLKTTNLLPAVLSIDEAEKSGCEIAIFKKGDVITEASHANVSIIKGDVLFTHPLNSEILPGISERNLIAAADKIGIQHRCETFSYADMLSADAVLVSSTTKLVRVCSRIDGVELPCQKEGDVREIFGIMRQDLLSKTS